MNLPLLIIAAIIIYILDIFALVWLSVRFVGINPLPIKDIGVLGLAIVLLSWLIGTAVYHVPLVIKPFILLLGLALILAFFVAILDTQRIKAVAAGLFFLLCQALLFIVLLRQFWSENSLQFIRYRLFDSY